MNQTAERLTGWLESEAKGRPVEEVFNIIDEGLRIATQNPVKRVLTEGTVLGLANHTLLIARDGTERPVADSGAPIRDDGGTIVGVVLVFRDQTRERAALRALEESEERFRRLVENAPEAIFVQAGGFFAYLNPAAVTLFGANSREELLQKPVLERFHPSFHEKINGQIELRDVEKKQAPPLEDKCTRLDGTLIDVAVSAAPIVYNNRHAVLIFARDISKRKRIEQEKERLETQLRQSQKVEAIGTLAGGIAHDFNNILQPIMGYTEMALTEPALSNPQRDGLEQVLNASIRARDLVRQILAVSRSTQEQQRTPIDISLIIKEALKFLRCSLPTSIEISQDIQLGIALADPTQIHQVLMNLCTNAAHAMDDRGVLDVGLSHIELSERDLAEQSIVELMPGPYLKLCVSDTGSGMDKDTLGHIFDPYFTTKEVGKGSGLGLAVVNGIVKRHEGAITVLSEPGRGTTFSVYIPRVDVQFEATLQVDDLLPTGTERILLVDDEQIIVELGIAILERLGYEVAGETNSLHALEIFRSKPGEFDLIVTDYTMPGLNGTDLAKEIRRVRPDIPVILSTGFSEKLTDDCVTNLGRAAYREALRRKTDSRVGPKSSLGSRVKIAVQTLSFASKVSARRFCEQFLCLGSKMLQMRRGCVLVQKFFALPIFIEDEKSRVIDCLVQIVADAALIGPAWLDESQEKILELFVHPLHRSKASNNSYYLTHHILLWLFVGFNPRPARGRRSARFSSVDDGFRFRERTLSYC